MKHSWTMAEKKFNGAIRKKILPIVSPAHNVGALLRLRCLTRQKVLPSAKLKDRHYQPKETIA